MIKLILPVLFVFGFSLASAQDHWLITAKLDTIRGKIFLTHGGAYQADEAFVKVGKTKSSYKAHQVRYVYLGKGQEFESIKLDNRYQFAKLDIKSKYFSHYLYIDPAAGVSGNYSLKLLSNWKGEMYKIGNLISRARFADIFEECERVSDKILSGELKKKNLDEIFQEFELCMDKRQANIPAPTVTKAPTTELMDQLINDIKSQGLLNEDLSNMITDINQKKANNQSIPEYLKKAVLEQLGENEDLKSKFNLWIQ